MTTPTQEALAALQRLEQAAVEDTDKADLATIRAALEESGRDAERYRWLRGQHGIIDPLAAVVWKQWHGQFNDEQWVNTAGPDQLDAAIDAARAKQIKGLPPL